MAHSKASICNGALRLLGKDALVQDADAPQQYSDADAVVNAYDQRFGRMLRSHNWNFAETLAVIDVASTAPLFGYPYKYPVPTVPPCARVWKLSEDRHGRDPNYVVRGGFIETDQASPLHVIYIARITDPALFDDEFAEALTTEIAAKCAVKILGSLEAADWFRKSAREEVSDARTADGQENKQQRLDEGTLLRGRRTG